MRSVGAEWAKDVKPSVNKLDDAAADLVTVGPSGRTCLDLLHAKQELEDFEAPSDVRKDWASGLDHLGTASAACGQGEVEVLADELTAGLGKLAHALTVAEKS